MTKRSKTVRVKRSTSERAKRRAASERLRVASERSKRATRLRNEALAFAVEHPSPESVVQLYKYTIESCDASNDLSIAMARAFGWDLTR